MQQSQKMHLDGGSGGTGGAPTMPPVWRRVSCHVCGVGWRDVSTTGSRCSSQEGKKSLSRAENQP